MWLAEQECLGLITDLSIVFILSSVGGEKLKTSGAEVARKTNRMAPALPSIGPPESNLAISVSLVSLDFISSSPAMASLMVVAILAAASPILASRWTSEVRAKPRD